MSTTRGRKPAGRRPVAGRKPGRKPAARKKQRRFTVRNPVSLRSPLVRNKRRPKRRTTLTVGAVVVGIVTVVAYIVVGVAAAVVTGLITGVAAGVAAARSEPDTPRPGSRPTPARQAGGRASSGPKTPPPGSVLCGAPTRNKAERCLRPTTPGRGCGIPGHPPPGAAAAP